MASLSFRAEHPLKWPDGWPRTPSWRRAGDDRFKCTPGRAMADLEANLTAIGATVAVVSSWLSVTSRMGVRLDMARNKLTDPGVALVFLRKDREHVLARDAFTSVFGNLRSIGLAIEGLRALERHGGASIMERAFAGFQALPPPGGGAGPQQPPPPVKRPWREVLGLVGLQGPKFAMLAGAEAAYRTLAKTAHPDSGGTAAAMAALNTAIAEAREECR